MHADHRLKLRQVGQKQWHAKLIAAGRTADAQAYAQKHSLDAACPGEAGVDGGTVGLKPDQSTPSGFFISKGSERLEIRDESVRETANCLPRGFGVIETEIPLCVEDVIERRRPELAPEREKEVDVVADPIIPFVRPLEALPMGVRWAEIRGSTRNLRLKIVRFCEGGNEGKVWIGWKDLSRMGRTCGKLVALVKNPDVEQGEYVLWRR